MIFRHSRFRPMEKRINPIWHLNQRLGWDALFAHFTCCLCSRYAASLTLFPTLPLLTYYRRARIFLPTTISERRQVRFTKPGKQIQQTRISLHKFTLSSSNLTWHEFILVSGHTCACVSIPRLTISDKPTSQRSSS